MTPVCAPRHGEDFAAAGPLLRDRQPASHHCDRSYRQPRPATPGAAFFPGPRPANPLVTKLQCFHPLGPDEAAALDDLGGDPATMQPEQVLVHDGEAPASVCLILEGFAYRYKSTADGRRQILGYLIPGDLCEVELRGKGRFDHGVAALSGGKVARIPIAAWTGLRSQFPGIDRGCALASLSERSILREWLMNVGQRNALQRLAHFFCEISARLRAIGHVNPDGSVYFPVSQAALADTTGLTTVHVNRSLKQLRKDGMIHLRRQQLTILDRHRLAQLAEFDGDYLRLKRLAE